MRINSMSQTTPINTKGLIGIGKHGRFNPEQSQSSLKLLQTFKNESWAMKTLCELYDVKAEFTTKWLKKHPLYDHPDFFTGEYMASYCQLDLFVKRISHEKKNFFQRIIEAFGPWQKITFGEYSDYNAALPLADAEGRMETLLRHIDFATVQANLQDENSEDIIIDKAEDYRKFGYL